MNNTLTRKGINLTLIGVLFYAINVVVTNSSFIVAMGDFSDFEDALLIIDSITDIIGVAAIVLIILGTAKLIKVCSTFKLVIPLVIVGILCTIAVDLVRDTIAYQLTWVMWLDIASTIISCLFITMLCVGLSKLYKENKNEKRAKKAIVVIVFYIILSIIYVLLMQFVTIFSGHIWDSELLDILIVGWFAVLLNIVANLIVILYLNKAKKELGK